MFQELSIAPGLAASSVDAASVTQKSYDDTASVYAEKVAQFFPTEEGEKFVSMVSFPARILDLGSGSGRDALVFSKRDLKVVGIDFSKKMIEIAKKTAPSAEFLFMDILQLNFPSETFDGIWANCSLLHIEKKAIHSVLEKIYQLLKVRGIFYLSLKEGDGEKIEEDVRYKGVKKFWSLYQTDEISTLLTDTGFTIKEIKRKEINSDYDKNYYLQIFCKKNKA